jgi:hypothetical protein
VFDVTSNTWTTTTLSRARSSVASTSVDNRYALFVGGWTGSSPSNVVDIFDSLSGMWNTTTLSQARYGLASTALGNLAFFGGGLTTGSQPSKVVDIFNSTSRTWSNTTLSQARYGLASSSIGEIVAFGSGYDFGSTYYSVVDILNVTSNTWFTVTLSQPRYWLASTSSINKIFFGGGRNGFNEFSVVDVFCFSDNCQPVISLPSPLVSISPISNSTTFSTINTNTFNPQTPFPSSIPLFVESPSSIQSNETNLQTNSSSEGILIQ